jgi:class 3 adenylate cyclase
MVREEVVAILFADAVNFSRLTNTQVPKFIEHFVGMVARLTRSMHVRLLAGNTWGDGLYFVFRGVREAGCFALALSERIGRTEWRRKGLPEDLNVRIALHAGPTFACIDPITRRRNYVGAHVSRAARIEPITPPGTVYASDAFAAIAAATNVSEFACEYAGQRPLAKGYGTLGTYRVHARATLSRTWK